MKRSMIPMIPEPEPMPSKSNAMFVHIVGHYDWYTDQKTAEDISV